MPFKAFWKSQIFTERRRFQNLSFWSNFDPTLPLEDGQNKKIAIGLSPSVKIKALSSINFQWKLLFLYALFELNYVHMLVVQMGPGSKTRGHSLDLAALFQKPLIKS